MTEQSEVQTSSTGVMRKALIAVAAVLMFLLVLLSAVSFLLSTQFGSNWAVKQLTQRLNESGVPIAVEGVQGTLFRGLSFRSIRYDDEGGSYAIEGLRTSWNPYSLLSGQLLLSDIWISRLAVELFESAASESEFDPESIQNPSPIGLAISKLRIERMELKQQEQDYVVRSIELGAELAGDEVVISGLQLSFDGLQLGGELSMDFVGNRSIRAGLDWSYTATLSTGVEELAGRLELNGDLSSLAIDHILESPQQLRSSGSLVTGLLDGELGFEIVHSAETLVLPIETTASYEISNVRLGTTGDIDEVGLSLQAEVEYEQYPNMGVSAEATLAGSTLRLASYQLETQGNALSGAATIDWTDLITVDGNYAMALENIASFVELPESVDIAGLAGSGEFDLTVPESGIEGRLTLDTQGGQVADLPIRARGAVFLSEGAIELEDLEILTQSNSVSLNGRLSDSLDLEWAVSVDALSEFLPGSQGVLAGSGSLDGLPTSPIVIGELSGSDISYAQAAIDVFSIAFERNQSLIESELTIGSLSFTDESLNETLSSIALSVSGSDENHTISVSAMSRFGEIDSVLSGGIGDLQNTLWTGRLESAAVDTPVGSWNAAGPAGITISSEGVAVGQTCWLQLETSICLELQQSSINEVTATGSLERFPLSLFNKGESLSAGAGPELVVDELILLPQLPESTTISGLISGGFTLLLPSTGMELDFNLAASDAVLSITPEQLVDEDLIEEEMLVQNYNLETLAVSGTAEAGNWRVDATTEILRENVDDSDIDARGEIRANVGLAADESITGSIEAELEDLRWVQAFVPELSNIAGSLNARANLVGSLSAPEATGIVSLEGASVSIDTLGINLADISANLSSVNSDTVQLFGRMRSAEGMLEFNGEILDPFASSTAFSAQIEGSDFELSNVPNLELSVSPNVVINADGTSIEVIGSLDVPKLKLTLEELPESAIDVSRDVVIVNYPSDRPDLARSIAATETSMFDRPLTGAIDITLGEDISFSGLGMNTKLAGNLNIQQTITGSNRTVGELTIVEGSYEMYRQSLNISQGKFLFFGAYDNPGIDLRATREVDDYTVGVLMNGTLKNINSQLFSTPALADNDIIAVLVTGRPFSEVGAQDGDALLNAIASLGVDRSEGLTNQVRSKLGLDVLAVDNADDINNSVLTIGKYLTPDIFIRYGIGLFDSQSKVAVDYTVSERIKLKAESGEYQSIDVIYSVER